MSTKRPPPLPPALPGVSRRDLSWNDENQPSRPPPRKSSKPRLPAVSPALKSKPPGIPIGTIRNRTATLPFAAEEHLSLPKRKVDSRSEAEETDSVQSPQEKTIELLEQRINLLNTLVKEKDEQRAHLMVVMTEITLIHDPSPSGKRNEAPMTRKEKRRAAIALTYLVRALVEALREDGPLEALLKQAKFRAELSILIPFFHT